MLPQMRRFPLFYCVAKRPHSSPFNQSAPSGSGMNSTNTFIFNRIRSDHKQQRIQSDAIAAEAQASHFHLITKGPRLSGTC